MSLETYANQFATSLSGNGGSITNAQTTINIASGTGAPSGKARFAIDSEIIVGTISGTVLTATIRGAEGTASASHTDGAAISCVLTAASLLASPGPMTAKGDLVVGAASGEPTRLGVGSNTQVLTADSTQTTGTKWATPAAGAGAGSPTLTLSTSNSAGSAASFVATDATISVFDATNPVTQALGDTAATGSAGTAARRDHKHALTSPSAIVMTATSTGSPQSLTINTDLLMNVVAVQDPSSSLASNLYTCSKAGYYSVWGQIEYDCSGVAGNLADCTTRLKQAVGTARTISANESSSPTAQFPSVASYGVFKAAVNDTFGVYGNSNQASAKINNSDTAQCGFHVVYLGP